MDYQDHDVVILRNKKNSKKEKEIKPVNSHNYSNNKLNVDFRKLDGNEVNKHKKVSLSLSKTIMQARIEKNLSQKDLATKINEKPIIINQYEQGKAIPNHQILMKMQKILKIKLTGKNMGDPLN